MEAKDLIGIGEAVKTVTDAVRGAISTLYRPTAIKKEGRAQTEVDAYRIETLAQAEVRAAVLKDAGSRELAERARQRFLFEQITQQESLENILQKAIEYSKEQPEERGREISEHWLYRLLINSKDVTNEEIQNIFAKIIVDQGSADKKPISYMTLDALRLFEPRHARYFEVFCKLFYSFNAVYFGVRLADEWIADEEFDELVELGMVSARPIFGDERVRFRDFTIDFKSADPSENFKTVFGQTYSLSLRGMELSKVLYPAVANLYWHGLRKDTAKESYENLMMGFVDPELQYQNFKHILDVLLDDNSCKLTVYVHQWDDQFKLEPIVSFENGWTMPSKIRANFYVPPYIRRFADEIKKEHVKQGES